MQELTIIYLKISMGEKFHKLWQYMWQRGGTTLNSSRSSILEVVRALTILWIAWYHIDQLMLPVNHEVWSIRTLASLGFAGVNVFLLLSGFVLTVSITKIYINSAKSWSSIPWKKFFIRRVLRIYPLYIFCHILFFITGNLMGKYTDMPLDIGFLLSVTGLKVFFPKYFWYGPDAFWFVGLIIQFYVLFPILFLLLLKVKRLKFLIIIFMTCTISRLITSNLEDSYILMLGLSTNRLAEFCTGMFIGYTTVIKEEFKISKNFFERKFVLTYFFLLVTLSIFLYYQPISLIWTVCSDLVLAIISFSCLISIAWSIKYVSSVYKFLILISQVSYGFYLLHSPPIRPVFAGLKTIGIHNFWLLTILYLLIITFFSFALTYVENLIFSARQKS